MLYTPAPRLQWVEEKFDEIREVAKEGTPYSSVQSWASECSHFLRTSFKTYLQSVRSVDLRVFFGLTSNDNGGRFAIIREQLVILLVSAIAADFSTCPFLLSVLKMLGVIANESHYEMSGLRAT